MPRWLREIIAGKNMKRLERFRRRTLRYTILIFMPVITVFSGCKYDEHAGFSESVKKAEYDETREEPDAFNGSKDINTMEIYEGVLNGDLTAERKGQQVRVNELFWDNDIKYCFFDIDGDGAEELHIRDHAVYYTVKIQDEAPRIIFEGWWDYEPVLTDRSGGILCYSHGYGSQHMEFIQISADGSIKSDGSYYWFDKNKNGNMDEEDSFIGPGDIDVGQYVQYMEEQNAKQAGNKLKWAGRRRDHSIIL